MKINWFYIKMILLLGLTVFLFAFSSKRNNNRKVERVAVNFEKGANLFITADAVDKLLIQNNKGVTGQGKEILDLKELEARLDAHAMISNSDVYLTLDGVLSANVKQRKPIARVQAAVPFYIDENGEFMPLSSNYSARVPLITGLSKDKLREVYPLIEYLSKDSFLKEHIVGLARGKDGGYTAWPRVQGYGILLGDVGDMESKFSNYKAFYQKALKDKSLDAYKKVDLRFKGQVVGTKK